ncbi:hypothetical protein ACFLY4_10050 [Chloroflexota bacterium]
MTPRVPRSRGNLVDALRRHVALLEDYSSCAFREGKEEYFGEVAGKLRVLVYESRRNRPLLLDLMQDYDISIPIHISRPEGDIEMSIDDFLDNLAFVIRVPSRGLVSVTNKQMISMWAQQYGASHEDWEVDEEFAQVLSSNIFIGGLPAAAAALQAVANTVLWLAKEFLTHLDTLK